MVALVEVYSMSSLKILFLISFVWSCLGIGTSSSQACDPSDLLVLKEFAGNLTNASIISAWSNDSSCCNWTGVHCGSGSNGGNGSVGSRVIKLVLSGKGLKGTISSSIGRLGHLQWLDLSYNSLEGMLPLEFSSLQFLEVLDLSNNALVGNISASLSGLQSIISLNISGNSFEGNLLDVRLFPDLVEFNVSNNLFSGEFTSHVCNSSNGIQVLDLSTNQLTGTLEGIENCGQSLRLLHLDCNSFSGHLPDALFSISSLEMLTISLNKFSGELSQNLSNLHSLKSLVIFGNQFSGPLPNVFGNLTHLEQFCAHTNSFSGSIPTTLALSSNLQVLDVRNNSLSGPINLNFTGLSRLCTLDLASNHFSGSLPSSLSSCEELKILSLAKNDLTGEIPTEFANLTSLLFISLSNNSFSNLSGALSVLQQCRNLSTIIFSKNFRGEEIPKDVSGFDSLAVLALGNCALKGQIPDWLLNCSRLEVLDLSWNHLNGSIPSWIGGMDNLFYLDFSNNSLTGEIPQSISQLNSLISSNSRPPDLITAGVPLFVKRNQSATGLQYNQPSSFPPSILLSNNQLTGKIWPEFGSLKELHVLDLSKNNISGTIPDSISEMSNLETLDLSYNDLEGTIPASLTKLTFLSKFSVAYNCLEGPIPKGNQFVGFPNSSYAGNSGLCGEIDSPCGTDPRGDLKPLIAPGSSSKFGRSSILGLTIGLGAGLAFILAIALLKMSRRHSGEPVQNMDEDFNRPPRLSETLGSSKLVLFQNSDCKELTVIDLLKSTNNFNQANIIGCGGFGLVYKAYLPNGTKAAIKRLSGDCGQVEREFRAEVEALSRAQHKNLVSLQGYCRHANDRLLIYSYMENGSLDYWLHERLDGGSVLTWEMRLKIAQGAAHGLAYLHKVCDPNIVHRDVKSSNILLDEKFEAHLADFGLSRLLRPYDTHVTTDLVGTLGYIPPEYSQTLTATFRGDVYSFGVVLLELLTGKRPVEVCKGKNCRDLVSWVFQMKTEKREEEIVDSTIWNKDDEKQFLDVLGTACQCIDPDPRRRPGIEQVVIWLDSVGTKAVLP